MVCQYHKCQWSAYIIWSSNLNYSALFVSFSYSTWSANSASSIWRKIICWLGFIILTHHKAGATLFSMSWRTANVRRSDVTWVRFDSDQNEPRVQKTDYGTVKEKTRYRGLNWETYETGSQLYLSIGELPLLCLWPNGEPIRDRLHL